MKFKALFKKLKGNEKGVTLLISVLILALLTVLVSAALINTTSSAVSTNNDAATKQAFYAAFGGLEKMSKEFSDIFTANTSLNQAQLDLIKNSPPSMPGITITQDIRFSRTVGSLPLQTGPYSGLNTLRDEYLFVSRAVTNSGVTVELSRSLYNNLIPIFQFGIFSTRHIEFFNGPKFAFGGRVHANGDVYIAPGAGATGGLDFQDRVTTTRDFVRQKLRNGQSRAQAATRVFNPVTSMYVTITDGLGSVNNGPNITSRPEPGHPVGTDNRTAFSTFITANVPGRLFFEAPPLKLPIQNGNNRPIELIRRGLPNETTVNNILAQSRFYNKAGLRITLSDTQNDLPGPVGLKGGVQLDAAKPVGSGTNYSDNRLGYIPKPLGSSYQASRINGHRLKGWIKIETVKRNTDGTLTETDVTEAILALGVTRYDDTNDKDDLRSSYGAAGANLDDSKSVIRLQRYSLGGSALSRSDGVTPGGSLSNGTTIATGPSSSITVPDTNKNRLRPALYRADTGTGAGIVDTNLSITSLARNLQDTGAIAFNNDYNTTTTPGYMLAYPINMFDTREGLTLDVAPTPAVENAKIETRGIMSMVDIDMNNLKMLLTGNFDGDFNNGSFSFRARNINSETNGWIIYVSDRRGDSYTAGLASTDDNLYNLYKGKYDCETVYGNNLATLPYVPSSSNQTLFGIEDTNDNGTIEASNLTTEGAAPNERIDVIDAATKGPWHPNNGSRINLAAATAPTPLFRRGVKLSNGQTLTQSAATAMDKDLSATRGLTMASENPVYLQGNYNTTGITGTFTNGSNPTTPANYNGAQVPAAIISDAITLLSNNWKDVVSFTSPHSPGSRNGTETAYRFAAFTGRTRDGLFGAANGAVDNEMWGVKGPVGTPESDDVRLYGGVHNFLRYLESWSGDLHYVGSLIDGWDSFQANGTYKCCTTVYGAPERDYTFDTSFLNATRLPPGTPNLQYILFTSFREDVKPVLP